MATMTMTKPDAAKALEYFRAKNAFTTGPVEVSYMIEEKRPDIRIVDVRAADDYAKGHIPGAVSLPRDKWSALAGLAKDKINILYCYSQTCHLAAKAGELFALKGYPVMEMEGGFRTWENAGLPIER